MESNIEMLNNNKVHIEGKIIGEIKFNHLAHNENFYEVMIEVKRLSGEIDTIPAIISEKLGIKNYNTGDRIAINGQFRSYNKPVPNGRSRLMLHVFARELIETTGEDINTIELIGFVCKDPIYRETPFNREITDLFIGVNRSYKKSDYIPLLAWGRNARFASLLIVGDKVTLSGRIQSRLYKKKIDDINYEERTAYEVSLLSLNKVDKEITE